MGSRNNNAFEQSGFDGFGSAGEEACGARISVALRFYGELIAGCQVRAEGASTAIAAADELEAMLDGASWRKAAAIGIDSLAGAARQRSGKGGRRQCPPRQAALFAVDALHGAFEDALRRGTFPPASGVRDDAVIVAMSGGVDSSTACLLEQRSGMQVTGVTMRLWSDPACEENVTSCCSPAAVADARAVCHELGIPHLTVDCVDVFEKGVVEYFVGEYLRGRTPNPCTWCNGRFRFPFLAKLARFLGAGGVVTGHYARIVTPEATAGETRLLARGFDAGKDQSYMLWGIPRELLSRIEFPLGEMTKDETRAIAAAAGLAVHERPESQEVCFIPDDDYRRFLRTRLSELPSGGDIVDTSGRVLGRHDSIIDYTVGQRRGMGVSAAEPLYVVRLETGTNTVVAGRRAELAVTDLTVGEINRFVPRAAIGDCQVQVRYNAAPVPASVSWNGDGAQEQARIRMKRAVEGVAPGQSAVMYRDDVVLAGGVIAAAS